jgi:hypothetical protein
LQLAATTIAKSWCVFAPATRANLRKSDAKVINESFLALGVGGGGIV